MRIESLIIVFNYIPMALFDKFVASLQLIGREQRR